MNIICSSPAASFLWTLVLFATWLSILSKHYGEIVPLNFLIGYIPCITRSMDTTRRRTWLRGLDVCMPLCSHDDMDKRMVNSTIQIAKREHHLFNKKMFVNVQWMHDIFEPQMLYNIQRSRQTH